RLEPIRVVRVGKNGGYDHHLQLVALNRPFVDEQVSRLDLNRRQTSLHLLRLLRPPRHGSELLPILDERSSILVLVSACHNPPHLVTSYGWKDPWSPSSRRRGWSCQNPRSP